MASSGKKAIDEGRTVIWIDQSGFYLLPMAVRTWAPHGQTPLLQVPLTHDHVAAIGGLTPEAPIHRGQPIKDFLARGAAKRLHLEQMPAYAPDPNPVEGLSKACRRPMELSQAGRTGQRLLS